MQNTIQDLKTNLKSPIPLLSSLLADFSCAIAGPFGTYETESFVERLSFSASILLIATVFSLFCLHAVRNFRPQWSFFEAAAVGGTFFTITYSLFLLLVIHIRYEDELMLSPLLIFSLVGFVTTIVAIIMNYLSKRPQLTEIETAPLLAPVPKLNQAITNSNSFLKKIDADMGSKLIRLHMRDHYVETYTCRGMQLIHFRFSDAVAALSDFNGLQVHRSHWVNLDEVNSITKKDGKACFHMSDGAEVPVARGKMKELKEMGIL